MHEPTIRHFYVKIQRSFVHLVQYGGNEGIIRSACSSASSSFASNEHSHQQSFSDSTNSMIDGRQLVSTSESSSSSPADKNKIDKLIVFVPGNPGILGVYHDFLITLYKTLARPSASVKNPVILAISHNNFDHPTHCDYRVDERIRVEEGELSFVERTKFENFPEPHEVEHQVTNKLIILKRFLKVDLRQTDTCKLAFVGHSVGCYVILRLLQDRALAKSHVGSILIHPALENLATTEKGAIIDRYFTFKLDYVMRMIAYVVEKILPTPTRLAITKWFCSPDYVESSSSIALESMAQMVCSNTLTALIEMAKSELACVRDLDHETMIGPHASKLKLIYTLGDHWVNDRHRLELHDLYPELHIEEQQTLHAFIMDPSVVTNYAIKTSIFLHDMFE